MPLLSYMLEQPNSNPIEILKSRISRLGADVDLSRVGNVIKISALDADHDQHAICKRAIRIVCEHADTARLTVEALVPSVIANTVSDYESCGFNIIMHPNDESEEDAHFILRRAARR